MRDREPYFEPSDVPNKMPDDWSCYVFGVRADEWLENRGKPSRSMRWWMNHDAEAAVAAKQNLVDSGKVNQ